MSQIAGAEVAHLARFPASGLDPSSLRCLRDVIEASIARHEAITATVPESERAEWDSIFADELAAARQARDSIVAELTRRADLQQEKAHG